MVRLVECHRGRGLTQSIGKLLSLMADAVTPAVTALATAAGISEADAAKGIDRLPESGRHRERPSAHRT